MAQSILSNLGILLLMFLVLSTLNMYQAMNKFSEALFPILYVIVVNVALFSLQMYPVKVGEHIFSLCMIPIILVTLFRGWKYGTSTSLFAYISWMIIFGLDGGYQGFFLLICPMVATFVLHKWIFKTINFYSIFFVTSAVFIVSEVPILINMMQHSDHRLMDVCVDYFSVLGTTLIISFFMMENKYNMKMEEELRLLGERDPLTGLYNMRKFNALINNLQTATINEYIAMIDIDHFKKINDTYGHQAGDEIIKLIGETLQQHMAANLVFARYGGDEFIAYLQAPNKESAIETLAFIQQKIETEAVQQYFPELDGGLKISMGIAPLLDHKLYFQTIKDADKMLYESKHRGRHIICG